MQIIHPKQILRYFLIVLLFSGTVHAQKKDLTLEDAVIGQWRQLRPDYISQLQFIPDIDRYSWVDHDADPEALMSGDGQSENKVLITLDALNASINDTGNIVLKSFPSVTWEDKDHFRFRSSQTIYRYDFMSERSEPVLSVDKQADKLDFSPDGKAMAYTFNNNLFIGKEGSAYIQVSQEGNPDVLCGQAVHRNEFGITKGAFWSPKGHKLAWYRMDQSMVTSYPLADISTVPATLKSIKYPMAGQTSHQVTMRIFDMVSKKTVYLETDGAPDDYLCSVSWDPEEKYLYIAHLNRDQNHLRLKKYNAATGEPVLTLFEERDEKYVEPEHPLYFLPDDPHCFLWFSDREGYAQLYLYKDDGVFVRKITNLPVDVLEILGYNKETREVIVSATDETGIERYAYAASIETGEMRQITLEKGVHQVEVSTSGRYLLDSYSNLETPRVVQLLGEDGKVVKKLLTADNPLKDYKYGQTELFTIKTDDNIDLWCRMIKPGNFDPAKKYPVLVYVYNGPHVQLINDSWLGGARLWMNWMAEHGYIVFTVDGRGSSNRGLAFEQATFRQLGTVEVEDQMKGVEYLRSLNYVDTARMAIHGWSYGGFMTISMMLRKPGVFKVAVAGGPVIDWKFYEVMYTERYMDTPLTNPGGYEEASLLNKVDKLRGKLMIIHGSVDDVVVPQHALSFLQKCVDNGVQLDYFVYPMHPHNVRGMDRVHLMYKVLHYVMDNL